MRYNRAGTPIWRALAGIRSGFADRALCSGAQREFPAAPRVGVAATVLARGDQPHEWRVLLIKRGNPPAAGLWSMPGGVLGLGEEILPAALREVQEETGICATIAPSSQSVRGSPASVYVVSPLTCICFGQAGDPRFFTTESIHRTSSGAVQFHYVLCHVLCFADDSVLPSK